MFFRRSWFSLCLYSSLPPRSRFFIRSQPACTRCLPLLATISVIELVTYLNTNRVHHLVFSIAATTLALFTHNFAVYLLAVHIFLFIYAGKLKNWKTGLLVLGIAGLCYLPG